MHDTYLTDLQVAERYPIFSVFTLRKWRQWGRGPSYLRVGKRKVVYRAADIEAYLNGCRQVPGEQRVRRGDGGR